MLYGQTVLKRTPNRGSHECPYQRGVHIQWWIQARGPEGPPPLFLDQIDRASPLSQGLDDSAAPLSEGLDPLLILTL